VIAGAAMRPTRYAVLLFVSSAAFITCLDRVCISVAAPAIQRDLGLSEIHRRWWMGTCRRHRHRASVELNQSMVEQFRVS